MRYDTGNKYKEIFLSGKHTLTSMKHQISASIIKFSPNAVDSLMKELREAKNIS